MRTWCTVDTDDLRHVPSHQGHPTRSKEEEALPDYSQRLQEGFRGFKQWMESNEVAVTVFVIADQCANSEFVSTVQDLVTTFGERITIGCHGLTHRSWSAWSKDTERFSRDLEQATTILKKHFPDSFRPWFRAPAGYISDWMAPILSQQAYTVDTSVNPSWLVRKKTSPSRAMVIESMASNGILERQWKTRLSLPTCGPAQHIMGLRWNARQAWKGLPKPLGIEDLHCVEHSEHELTTIYWHILDHTRKNQQWFPPIKGV